MSTKLFTHSAVDWSAVIIIFYYLKIIFFYFIKIIILKLFDLKKIKNLF